MMIIYDDLMMIIYDGRVMISYDDRVWDGKVGVGASGGGGERDNKFWFFVF